MTPPGLPVVVRRFFDAIGRRDAEQAGTCLTDDVVYWTAVPNDPHRGRAQVVSMLDGLLGASSSVAWEIVRSTTDGTTVWTERVDRFVLDGRELAMPCAGVLELDEAGGLIAEIRDYCDLATWSRQREASSAEG